MIFWILFLPALYFALATLYLASLAIAALAFRKRCVKAVHGLRLGILIPAHNEAEMLPKLLGSIKLANYDPAHLSVFVVADNCWDKTAHKARALGATVFERHDPEHLGKGYALDWFLTQQRAAYEHVDALVIIDADSVIYQDSLQELARSLAHPDVDIVQMRYGTSNVRDSWVTTLSQVALQLFNHIRPAGLATTGGSAGLKGNGMGFKAEILRQRGWPAYSVVEDLEYTLQLVLKGYRVHYNPDARVDSEMPHRARHVIQQRQRWDGDRLCLLRRYSTWLLRRPYPTRLHAFAQLAILPISLVALGVMLVCAAAYWVPGLHTLAVISAASLCLYVLGGLLVARAPLSQWLALLTAPAFILLKVVVTLKLLLTRGPNVWQRTRRKHEL